LNAQGGSNGSGMVKSFTGARVSAVSAICEGLGGPDVPQKSCSE